MNKIDPAISEKYHILTYGKSGMEIVKCGKQIAKFTAHDIQLDNWLDAVRFAQINEWPYPEIHNRRANNDYSWKEVSEEVFWDQLEVLPPAKFRCNAFAVGEPYNWDGDGSIHTMFVEIGDRYFCKDDLLKDFDPDIYTSQIKEQFGIR